MSIFGNEIKRGLSGPVTVDDKVSEITTTVAAGGTSTISADKADSVLGCEDASSSNFLEAKDTFDNMYNTLKDVLVGVDVVVTDPSQIAGLENATLGVIATGNPAAAIKSLNIMGSGVDPDIEVIHMQNLNDATEMGLESFDPESLKRYVGSDAALNFSLSSVSALADLFYPREIVASGSKGVYLEHPHVNIYSPSTKNADGTVVENVVTPLIDVYKDHTALKFNALAVVPYASSATEPAKLVAQAIIPDETIPVGNVNVTSRPILFNEEVEVVGISQDPGLIKSGVFSNEDTLDPDMNIGTLYFGITAPGTTPQTVYAKVDVSTQVGTNLERTSDGGNYDYAAQTSATIVFGSGTTVLSGDFAAWKTNMETLLGLNADDTFSVEAVMDVTMKANTETTVISAYPGSFVIKSIMGPVDPIADLSTLSTATLIKTAYLPKLKLSNSSLRVSGTNIDVGLKTRVLYPNPVSSPFNMVTPVDGTSVDTEVIIKVVKASIALGCINNLLDEVARIESFMEHPTAKSPWIASNIINPVVVRNSLNVSDSIVVNSSGDSLSDLRGVITNFVRLQFQELMEKSGYLTGLAYEGYNQDDFEVNILTTTKIASWLGESGEDWVVGKNIKVNVAIDESEVFTDSMYMTVRLKSARTAKALNKLSWGALLLSPSITTDTSRNHNGGLHKQTVTTPRANPHVGCPVIAVLTFENLLKAFDPQVV